MRVALVPGCLASALFPGAVQDARAVLEGLGVTVTLPPGQTCCGQPAFNAGYRREAAAMARHTVDVLHGADDVVLLSGSCAAYLRRTPVGLLRDPLRRTAEALAERTWEFGAFLVRVLGAPRLGDGLRGARIAYHHGCHALRHLGEREEPIELLRHTGAEVVEWASDGECCGFGGLFSTKLPEVSAAMADRKLDTVPRDVEMVVSADGGCLLQLAGRASRRRRQNTSADADPRFVHLATALRMAMPGGDRP